MLARPLRLNRDAEFRAVYAAGRARRTPSLVCLVLEKHGATTRAGVVASRKVGGSVKRNLAKRRLRNALRNLWRSLPQEGYHIVLVATAATWKVEYAELVGDLRRLLSHHGLLDALPQAGSPTGHGQQSGNDR